ncbi:MAG: biotin/lipoyl-binding protein [Chloroflexi bacterium]|nr:biotin/lipoyl-binding protein [Chloroflexota bacterium]
MARVHDRVFRIQVRDACPPTVQLVVDGIPYEVVVEGLVVSPRRGPAVGKAPATKAPGAVKAQMTGKVVSVRVKVGERVAEGDLLLVLEAMKMENEIHAPLGGVVKQVAVAPGAQVALGDLLVVVE